MRLFQQQFVVLDPSLRILIDTSTNLITTICGELGLNLPSCHYSLWLFHASINILGFKKTDRYIHSCACIILGMKLGECLKRLDDLIKIWRRAIRRINKKPMQEDSQETLRLLKKKVLEGQVNLLISFGFDLDIRLGLDYLQHIEEFLNNQMYDAVKHSLTDIYRTPLVVYFDPYLILLACVQICSRHLNIEIRREVDGVSKTWYTAFSETTQLSQIEDIVKKYCLFSSPEPIIQ